MDGRQFAQRARALAREKPSAAGGPAELRALAEIPLFCGLTTEQLGEVQPTLFRKCLPADAMILEEAEPGDIAYIVHDGFVRIQVTQADGTDIILAILGAGDIVGEMSLVDRLGRSATVMTHEPAKVFAIERATFAALLRRIPAMSHNLTAILSRRLRLANAHIRALATLEVDGRIAHELLAYATEYGEPQPGGAIRLPFHLTQSDLAALVGASRVRVNQVLVEYKRRGYLSVDERHRITIHDVAALVRHDRDSS